MTVAHHKQVFPGSLLRLDRFPLLQLPPLQEESMAPPPLGGIERVPNAEELKESSADHQDDGYLTILMTIW